MLSLLAPSRPASQRAAPDVYAPSLIRGTASFGLSDRNAPTIEQQRYAYRGLVYTCARLRSQAVASAMMTAVVEREATVGEFQPVELVHPWMRLLRAPNPFYPPGFFYQWVQKAKDLSKGAFLVVERDGAGVPLWLHPVFPVFGEMRPVGDSDGAVAYYVFFRADGERMRFETEDVVWIRHPHPVSPYESASLLEAAAYEIDTDLYAHVYRRDVMKAGGIPAVQVTTEQTLTEPEALRYSRSVTEKLRGDAVPVFGKGAELKPVGLHGRDLEFIEGANLTQTELMWIFGVMKGMLSDEANRANADSARATFYQNTVQTEADDMADQLTADLVRAFRVPRARSGSSYSVLVVRAPDVVPLDPELVLKQDESKVKHGLKTINEIRERDGDDPLPGGDEPLVSSLLAPLADVAALQGLDMGDDDDDPFA